jgi:hypothetical protein
MRERERQIMREREREIKERERERGILLNCNIIFDIISFTFLVLGMGDRFGALGAIGFFFLFLTLQLHCYGVI